MILQSISCSYYEGEGLLSTAGCETVDVTDEYVDCAYVFLFLLSISSPFSPLSLPPFFTSPPVVTTTPISASSSQAVITKNGRFGEY